MREYKRFEKRMVNKLGEGWAWNVRSLIDRYNVLIRFHGLTKFNISMATGLHTNTVGDILDKGRINISFKTYSKLNDNIDRFEKKYKERV